MPSRIHSRNVAGSTSSSSANGRGSTGDTSGPAWQPRQPLATARSAPRWTAPMLAVRHHTTAATADTAARLRLAATTRVDNLKRTSYRPRCGRRETEGQREEEAQSDASFPCGLDDQFAFHPGMAGATVFRASEGERSRLVGDELHRDGFASVRDYGFDVKRFDCERVRTVR